MFWERFKGLTSGSSDLEDILNRSPMVIIIWRVDDDWSVDFVSENISQFGYTPEDLISGKISWTNITHSDDVSRLEAELKKYFNEGVYDFEQHYRLYTKSGEIRWVEDRTQAVFDDHKNITHYQVMLWDVTKKMSIEEDLRESEQKYKAVIENIGIGVAIISPNMEILTLNRQMRKWFPNTDVKNKPICYMSYNDPPRKALCNYCPTHQTLLDGQVHESVVEFSCGEGVKNYRVISTPVTDVSGKITCAIEMVEDITEKLKTEEILRKVALEGMKGEFVSMISHELRTPLAIIKEKVGIVLGEITGKINEKQHEMLTGAQSGIDRLTSIINDLLDVSKIESGKFQLNITNTNVVELIKDVVTFFNEKVQKKKIKIQTRFSSDSINVNLDNERIISVLSNLLNNSIKYTDKGYIEVSAVESDEHVEFCVADTGRGIKKEEIPNLFEKFWQSKSGLSNHEKGTGLGLAICKGIVEMHNGKIWAESEGGITSFKFTIPK